jgi:hypothetical protein
MYRPGSSLNPGEGEWVELTRGLSPVAATLVAASRMPCGKRFVAGLHPVDLAAFDPGPATAAPPDPAGSRAKCSPESCCPRVWSWHETDMPTALRDVRSQRQSGKHILAVSFSVFGPTRTLQSLGWSNCLFRPRPHEVSFVGLSNIRVNGVSVLEVRIVFGRSSTLVSNQARCIQVAA